MGGALALLSDDPVEPAPARTPTVLPQEAGEADTLELALADVVAEDIVCAEPRVLPTRV